MKIKWIMFTLLAVLAAFWIGRLSYHGKTPEGMNNPAPALNPSSRQQAPSEMVTWPVMRKAAYEEINLSGHMAFDESRLATISARFPGRIDRLSANYTGLSVREGDPLAELYSPEMTTAQQELYEAATLLQKTDSPALQKQADAARAKLNVMGIDALQIREAELLGAITQHVTIGTPIRGMVIEKAVSEGEYVQTGTRLFTVADLSRLWVLLDGYERDAGRLRTGQPVELTTPALPGHVFEGLIAFVDPVLSNKTRTFGVRVEVDNAEGLLKPGMLAQARARVQLDERGRVMSAATKPRHSLNPLVIPASAPLLTGKGALVYVETGEGHYEGREVTLGPRAGDVYIVLEGLNEGENVVVQGAFKLDGELQIMARPSMMNPTEHIDTSLRRSDGATPTEFRDIL
ncbi:MAG: efflux RND transporter periplasmic adaptor subunit [Spartobacteria bacterium]|nr:efflux RND transporter periplasmic adaptor subunit [Spartobacteria bacterium]